MFPTSDTNWIEEPLNLDKKASFTSVNNGNIIEVEKIFYHMDSEDMVFRMKINCLAIKDDSKIAENKIWGICINDSHSKKLLFALQVNDTNDNCTIDLLNEDKINKTSIEGKISDPEKEDDNIRITLIPSEDLDKESISPVEAISFYLDFKFPNKLIYTHISNLVGKDLNCFLTHYITQKKK
jgi:hypothetical protein